jgi:hypothetical protein
MKATLSPVAELFTAGALALMLSACAAEGGPEAPETSAPPTETARSDSLMGSDSLMVAEERGEREARIEAVDTSQRTVTLRTPKGQTKTLPVPPNIDIARIRVGDTLVISVYQSLTARVLASGSAKLGATLKADPPPSQGDGGSWTQRLILVNEVTEIDQDGMTATLQGADRQPRKIKVKTPEMQQRLQSLKVGDLLELTFTEVFSSRIKPAA